MQGKNSLDALSALASVDCRFSRSDQSGLRSGAASFLLDIVGVCKVQRQGARMAVGRQSGSASLPERGLGRKVMLQNSHPLGSAFFQFL